MKSDTIHNHIKSPLVELLYYIRERKVSYVLLGSVDPVSLSFIDSVKASLLKEAANVGLNNESLQSLDNNLQGIVKVSETSVGVLEKYVIDILLGGYECCISFNRDGVITESINRQAVVSIDLREIINNTFPGLPIGTEELKLSIIKRKEQQVIDILREQNFHTIKVIKRGKALDRVECEEKLPIHKRVIDIMKEAAFQNIEIKQESGKPVYMNRVVKTKL
jgi:hypothetical protein